MRKREKILYFSGIPSIISFLIRTEERCSNTVGQGIAPCRGLSPFADCTADMDFHHSPKIFIVLYCKYCSIIRYYVLYNILSDGYSPRHKGAKKSSDAIVPYN